MKSITFDLIPLHKILDVLPLLIKLNKKDSEEVLKKRLLEMVQQNYECIGVYDGNTLIGMAGLWFQTRHYSGRSIEPDHVIIEEAYRQKGIGKLLFNWIETYAKNKGCEAIELNAYVQNSASHKFYLNDDFKILGFHFVKRLLKK